MNDMTPDAWFFTHEGEKIGPVSLSDLRMKATEGSLNPRLDLVWTHGMPNWTPAGEIDGLFQRRPLPEKLTPEPATDLYRPPAHDQSVDPLADPMSQESNWPGARRRAFIAGVMVLPLLGNFVIGLLLPVLSVQFDQEIANWIALGSVAFFCILAIIFGIQRLANLGMSRWWYLGNFIPLLNFWIAYRCFVCPAGYAYHRKMDSIGILLAIIYWLSVALVALAIGLIVAVLLGAIGSPEMRKLISEALKPALSPQP